jgi:hypothetical protein
MATLKAESKHGLEAAYRNTTFCVDYPARDFGIRIGELCTLLDALLHEHSVTVWAYVTACNPRSQKLPDDVNTMRQAELLARVQRLGYPVFPGRGIPDQAGWQPEESLLILGMPEPHALQLGITFGQYAIVAGTVGGPAKLCWCELAGDASG